MLLFLTPVFQLIPYNVIAAIVISGVSGLFEYQEALYLYRVSCEGLGLAAGSIDDEINLLFDTRRHCTSTG